MQPRGQRVGSRLDRLSLADVAHVAAGCQLCRLCDTRRNVVFGSGSERASVLFVSEAPGYHEDRTGAFFAGAIGELFDRLLEDAGLHQEDVYVTSAVKCRPPRNRTPFPDEIEQCEGYLFRQVTAIQPDVVCALGNVPIRLLTGRPLRLSDVHGQPVPVAVQGRTVVVYPLYHPGAAVQVPALERVLREDLQGLRRMLASGEIVEGLRAAEAPDPRRRGGAAIADGQREDSAVAQLSLDVG